MNERGKCFKNAPGKTNKRPHMKVSTVLKGRPDHNGHLPIVIRISHEGIRKYHPTNIRIDPELFKDGKVKPQHPKAKQLNQSLQVLTIQYQAQALEGFKKKIPKTDFYKYVESQLPNLTREPGTKRYYKSQIKKLKEFAPVLLMDSVNKEWLNRYKSYLQTKGNSSNTIWSAFKFIRTFIRTAYKDKLIKDYPFDNYEFPKYREKEKNYLTTDEIQGIEKLLSMELPPMTKEAALWFLIACNTGLRISDIKNFSRKNIVGNRLVLRVQKTKEMVGLPLTDKVRGWMEQVGYKLSMSKNTYNGLIKIVCAAAGINKHVSTHTGRHTAAMMLMDAGVSQEVVARVLGHKDLRATSTYAKISNKRIDDELKKLK